MTSIGSVGRSDRRDSTRPSSGHRSDGAAVGEAVLSRRRHGPSLHAAAPAP